MLCNKNIQNENHIHTGGLREGRDLGPCDAERRNSEL